ncbi:MAG: hypothetical protein IJF76_05370 [Clostridia bacterium]|nr:hypothetical protein [Clostridia bacterium]
MRKIVFVTLIVILALSLCACGETKIESVKSAFESAGFTLLEMSEGEEIHEELLDGYDVDVYVYTKGSGEFKSVSIVAFSSVDKLKDALSDEEILAQIGAITGGMDLNKAYDTAVKNGRINGECLLIVNVPPLTQTHKDFIQNAYEIFKNA